MIDKLSGRYSSTADIQNRFVKFNPLKEGLKLVQKDPRIIVAVILFTYLILGFTVFGFNRSPIQVLITTFSACSLEVLLTYISLNRYQKIVME